MIFGIKKINNFDPYNVFLAIATNIAQQIKTGFVVQGHICSTLILINKCCIVHCLFMLTLMLTNETLL